MKVVIKYNNTFKHEMAANLAIVDDFITGDGDNILKFMDLVGDIFDARLLTSANGTS